MGNLWMCIDITLLPISDRYIFYINFPTIERDYPKTYYTFECVCYCIHLYIVFSIYLPKSLVIQYIRCIKITQLI